MYLRRALLFFIILYIFNSCNVVKHLPEDKRLYKGAEIDLKSGTLVSNLGLKGSIKDIIQPEPNRRVLGIPFRLWLYNLAGDSVPSKGFRHWLKEKAGEEPVIYNDMFAERSRLNIQNYLFNNGYFDSEVSFDVDENNRKVKILYEVEQKDQYKIASYKLPEVTDSLSVFIKEAEKKSVIKSGNSYSIDDFTEERQRISDYLKNNGYYAFSPDYFVFKIDSNVNEKKVDVTLNIKENTPEKASKIYLMNNINVYPDFTLGADTFKCDTVDWRSLAKRGFKKKGDRGAKGYKFFFCNPNIKPYVLRRSILFEKGNVYRTSDYTSTINKLMGLGVFKFANIELNETGTSEVPLLDANIYLTQTIPRSFRAEIQAVSKSNGFVGPGLNLSYTDRNLLKGAESFSLSTLTGFETQLSQGIEGLFSYEVRFESGLMVPKLMVPFVRANRLISKKYTSHTQIKAGFGYSDRVNYFTNRSIDISYGYGWRESTSKSHEFTPISIDYSFLGRISPLFDSITRNDELIRQSFLDRFIFSLKYDYILNSQLENEERDVNGFFNFNIEFAGNTLNLLNRVFKGEKADPYNPTSFLGTPYSQYVRTFTDSRAYFNSGKNNMLVTRLFLGLGVPYGNSRVLPFSRQFFAGGASSLRGFRYRSVGPGSYISLSNERHFIDQAGDIKIEGNIEFRFVIAKILRGALFTDAGNVWLIRAAGSKPGGEFTFDSFAKEIGVNVGFGLRLDVTFFVLRLDLAFPVRIPYLPENERWVFNKIDFSSSSWRKDNLILNIAIGYPF